MIQRVPSTFFIKFAEWYKNLWISTPPKPPYNDVCYVGDSVLRTRAQPVDVDQINKVELRKLINKMKTVMRQRDACGLAAPQIGCPLRIFVAEYTTEVLKRYPIEIIKGRDYVVFPFQAFINPSLTIVNKHIVKFPEGCECIKGYSAVVPRYYEVRLTALNEDLEEVSWQVKGWPARILQHEMDHLDGKLYIDIMDPMTFQFDMWYEEMAKRKWPKLRIR